MGTLLKEEWELPSRDVEMGFAGEFGISEESMSLKVGDCRLPG